MLLGGVIEIYKTMLQEARNNIQRAVIGKGPFQLAPAFSHLECSDQQWMEKTPKERRKHLDKLCTSDAMLPLPSIDNNPFSSKSHVTITTISSEDVPADLKTSASEVKVVPRGLNRKVVLPSVNSVCTSSTITSPGSSTDATNESSSLGESTCARNIGQFRDSGLHE